MTLVDSDIIADECIDLLKRADNKLVCIDTESTGIDGIKDGRDYLTGIAVGFCVDGGWYSYYYPIRHKTNNCNPRKIEQLRETLKNAQTLGSFRFIYHNAKFDFHSLATLGEDWAWQKYQGDFFCTLTMAHMINEEFPSKELSWLSKKFLKDDKLDELQEYIKIFGWAKVPPHLMEPYACHDVYLTYKLLFLFWPEMKNQDLRGLWKYEMDFIRQLCRAESNGVMLVKSVAEELSDEGTRILANLEREFGFRLSQSTELSRIFFDELKMPVLELTPGGKPSLNKHVMEQYEELLSASNNPLAQKVLEYRGWQKAVSTWYNAFPLLCSPDGRIRTNFKVHGTRTGRLSSSKPNLQQLPRNTPKAWNGRARKCFTHDEGTRVVKFDFKNLELRIVTDFAQIKSLLDAFENNGDPHQVTADRVKIQRNPDAKNLMYAMQFRAGHEKLAYMLNRKPEEGLKVYNDFHSSYPEMRMFGNACNNKALERGYIKYWTGRRKHYNFYNKDREYFAICDLIQGSGAEIVKRAALRCADLEGPDCQFVLTVHDELDFQIKEELLDTYIPEIKRRMEITPDERFSVNFDVEHSLWGEK